MNNNQHNALYNGYIKIKSLIKRDGITLATEHLTTTTVFKYMPLNNSHVTLNTCKNPYSTPGTNIMNGSVLAHAHTHTHAHAHACSHARAHTRTHTHTHTHTATMYKAIRCGWTTLSR